MARKGRKRLAGARWKNGNREQSKAARAARGDKLVEAVALEQPHRAWLPEQKRRDQHAATVLGRLFLAGIITEEMLWAGERFGRLRREFAKVLATPMTTKSAGFDYVAERVEAVEGYEMQDAVRETDEERRDRVVTAFNEVSNAIGWLNTHGPVTRELDAVCNRDQEPANLSALLAGLAGLVRLWGLDASRKSRGVRGFRTEKPTWDETLHEKVPAEGCG